MPPPAPESASSTSRFHTFSVFFAYFVFLYFPNFFAPVFIAFWMTSSAANTVQGMLFLRFPCCEKVSFFITFGLPEWARKLKKEWFLSSYQIWISLFFAICIFQECSFCKSKTIVFEGPAVRSVFWKIMIFMLLPDGVFRKVQTSLFVVSVGSRDLLNRPWRSPT